MNDTLKRSLEALGALIGFALLVAIGMFIGSGCSETHVNVGFPTPTSTPTLTPTPSPTPSCVASGQSCLAPGQCCSGVCTLNICQ